MNKIVVALLALLLTSCITYERCTDKYGIQAGDTILKPIVVNVPIYIQVPPDSAKLQAALDSLLAGHVIKTDTVKTDSSNVSIEIWYNKDNNTINAKATTKPFIIIDTIPFYDTIPVIAAPIFIKPLTFKGKMVKHYTNVAKWGFPFTATFFLLIVVGVIKAWIRKRY